MARGAVLFSKVARHEKIYTRQSIFKNTAPLENKNSRASG
jgi:hypothetical protein